MHAIYLGPFVSNVVVVVFVVVDVAFLLYTLLFISRQVAVHTRLLYIPFFKVRRIREKKCLHSRVRDRRIREKGYRGTLLTIYQFVAADFEFLCVKRAAVASIIFLLGLTELEGREFVSFCFCLFALIFSCN